MTSMRRARLALMVVVMVVVVMGGEKHCRAVVYYGKLFPINWVIIRLGRLSFSLPLRFATVSNVCQATSIFRASVSASYSNLICVKALMLCLKIPNEILKRFVLHIILNFNSPEFHPSLFSSYCNQFLHPIVSTLLQNQYRHNIINQIKVMIKGQWMKSNPQSRRTRVVYVLTLSPPSSSGWPLPFYTRATTVKKIDPVCFAARQYVPAVIRFAGKA